MTYLEQALRLGFEKLTKEELVDLSIELVKDGLHIAGRKRKPKPKTLERREK